MMARLIFVIIFIIVLGALFLPLAELPSSGAEKENPYLYLENAMEVTGAGIYEGEVHYWASLDSHQDEGELLEEQALKLGELLGINNPGISRTPHQPGEPALPSAQVVELEQELPEKVHGRLLLQKLEEQGSSARHLVVSLTQKESTDDLADYAFKMPAVFNSRAEKSNISYCLTGHLEEELSVKQMQDLAELMHHELDATIMHGFQEGPLVSVTGYSPFLGNYFQVEDEKYNLNVALRYDDYQEKTVIWVGTPLIARSY